MFATPVLVGLVVLAVVVEGLAALLWFPVHVDQLHVGRHRPRGPGSLLLHGRQLVDERVVVQADRRLRRGPTIVAGPGRVRYPGVDEPGRVRSPGVDGQQTRMRSTVGQ